MTRSNLKLLFEGFCTRRRPQSLLQRPRTSQRLKLSSIYQTILIPVENSPADQTVLDHITPLAKNL
jgi:hypothetical protein